MKAMFLLVVFLLNSVTGFACAIGMNMGYNEDHHQSEISTEHYSQEHEHSHKHPDGHKHQHADLADHDTNHPQKQKDDKDNCCKDAVAKLTASDKLTQRIFDVSQLTLSFIILSSVSYQYDRAVSLPVSVPNAYFSRHCRSPIPDVRIAIQSFQI